MKSQTSINKLQKYKINIISLKYVHIPNNKFWINLINQTYYKYFLKSFSNNIIFFLINRINIPTLSIFHFQQKNLTLWKKTQLNVAKKKKTKGKKKEKILEAAQCPFNGLQRENPSCRNTRRLLYKLPFLEKFGRGGGWHERNGRL